MSLQSQRIWGVRKEGCFHEEKIAKRLLAQSKVGWMQLSLHHKCQISRIARFSLLESLRMRIGEKSTPFMPSFRFFSPFLAYSDKGQKVRDARMKREMMLHLFAHCTMAEKNPQTATPVLSSSRIICKICNLFSKFFTYVYIYNRRRRRSVSLFVQKLVPCRRWSHSEIFQPMEH